MQRWVYFFGQGQADGGSDIKHLVGGKGASLADMTKAGLNVPPGFTISAECCDHYYQNGRRWPDGLADELMANLSRLEQLTGREYGHGDKPLLVAVRSGAERSMPGMMDTVLNVGRSPDPGGELYKAIDAVFDSWNSERAATYRKHHKVEGLLGTAVTVQAMCPSEISGVLFTANPIDPRLEQIVVESTIGLGEALVLGKVTPDRFVLDKASLHIVERNLAGSAATLADEQVRELARLGLRVEAYFGHPCDIEWGLSGGQFYLLQSRLIKQATRAATMIDPAERERVRQEEMAALRAKAAPDGTVWSRFNLYEILPEPTPMTWAIVKQFMSGQGGYGLMYRDLGFDPDPALDEEGVFDLICGRPYCNLSLEPRMQYRTMPFEHPFALLKKNPAKALYPQAVLNPARASWRFWLFLPFVFFKLFRANLKLTRIGLTFESDYVDKVVPPFANEVEKARKEDWTKKTDQELLDLLNHWRRRTLVDFARDSLKPTALAAIAMGNLERALTQRLQPHGQRASEDGVMPGLKKAQEALRKLVMGARPFDDTDVVGAMRAARQGRLSHADFLANFGHRGSQEMELARPRWAEDPSDLDLSPLDGPPEPSYDARQAQEHAAWRQTWDAIADEAKILPAQRQPFEAELIRLKRFLALRESGKHHLLSGYALIRRALVELDCRHGLDSGIFFLTPDDLPRLITGGELGRKELLGLIVQRKRRRDVALSLPVPQVLYSDDLEAIGRDVAIRSAGVLQGVALSAGTAEADAWVLDSAAGATLPADPYILVCPSTDPAWLPLFVHARGLVMETGGVLSHGAIVARDFGLPAVAGIADVHRRLKTGQRLRIDGGTGRVEILGSGP